MPHTSKRGVSKTAPPPPDSVIKNVVYVFDRSIYYDVLGEWRRMEKISWTDHVRNEDVSLRVNGQRNIHGRLIGLVISYVETAF
jgi:hypothetical protein